MTSDITPITATSKGGTTAQTAIEIPDYVTMITPAEKWSIGALAEYAADLLSENHDLPGPVYFTVTGELDQVPTVGVQALATRCGALAGPAVADRPGREKRHRDRPPAGAVAVAVVLHEHRVVGETSPGDREALATARGLTPGTPVRVSVPSDTKK